jgi:hypothetical protein
MACTTEWRAAGAILSTCSLPHASATRVAVHLTYQAATCLTWLQRSRVKLGQWLRGSTQSVDVRELRQLMERLKCHELVTYRNLEDILHSGKMPGLVFSPDLSRANPALLCLMHFSRSASVAACTSVPTHMNALLQVSSMSKNQPAQEPLDQNCVAGDVEEVWWLFDSGAPYLAEVFKGGAVPAGRLPHRSSIQGKHVARVRLSRVRLGRVRLGRRHSFIKLLARSARIILLTAWYPTWGGSREVSGYFDRPAVWRAGHQQLRRLVPMLVSGPALAAQKHVKKSAPRASKQPLCITCARERRSWRVGRWTWLR